MSTQTKSEREPRRRLTAAARREVIAVAAAELFAERGYRGASIEEIARRSGVTPPVVYEHFESKRELYRDLLERHFAAAVCRDPVEDLGWICLQAWRGRTPSRPARSKARCSTWPCPRERC